MGRPPSRRSSCFRSTAVCHRELGPQTSRQGPSQVCYSHVCALPWTGGLVGRRKFGLTLAAAIQAEEKDAGLQDDRVARKQRYVTALEKKLGGRLLEGLFKFKGSYSRFRCAPKAGELKATDLDVGSVAVRASMFANPNPNPNP